MATEFLHPHVVLSSFGTLFFLNAVRVAFGVAYAKSSGMRNSTSMPNRHRALSVGADEGRSLLLPNQLSRPGKLYWVVAILLLIVQQGAFVSIPPALNDISLAEMQEGENIFNFVGVSLSLVLVVVACLFLLRRVAFIARSNALSVFFILMIFASLIWSIHPDLTLRRGIGYVVTMLVVAFMPAKFEADDAMRALSWSFAISAIGSFLFVAAFPERGIMQFGELAGSWRGVFGHKSHLGSVMAAAIFVELYILAVGNAKRSWRLPLLGCYFVLLMLSRAIAPLLLSLFYLAGACVYALWKRDKLIALVSMAMLALISLIIQIIVWFEPEFAFGLIDKDPTLTGRTELWLAVIKLIEQKPILGWGYRAVWWETNDSFGARIASEFNWAIANSHNAFLEIALQLGLLGFVLITAIVCLALWRAMRCYAAGVNPLGWFSLMFFLGTILAGQTETSLGQNQTVEWLVFNILMVFCGLRTQISPLQGQRTRPKMSS